jgi:fructose 1,6-bisphosphatase
MEPGKTPAYALSVEITEGTSNPIMVLASNKNTAFIYKKPIYNCFSLWLLTRS